MGQSRRKARTTAFHQRLNCLFSNSNANGQLLLIYQGCICSHNITFCYKELKECKTSRQGREEHDLFSVPSPQGLIDISTRSLINYKEFSISDMVLIKYVLFLLFSWRSNCNPTDSMQNGEVAKNHNEG